MEELKNSLTHKQNFLDILRDDIINFAEENSLTLPNSAVRILLEWLGYDISELNFLDSKDSGIDAWNLTENGLDIYQVKTHDFSNTPFDQINTESFDNSGINDLSRAKNLLCSYKNRDNLSNEVKYLLDRWAYLLRNSKEKEIESPTIVTLNLIVLGDGLTSDAKSEFDRFRGTNEKTILIDNVEVKFDTVFYDIDSIIKIQWQEENREWKDITGKKKTSIDLQPTKDAGYITDNKNAIFYCYAYDLVKAYDSLGYQLFEPNVRAEIKRSKVNESIRESIRHARSRKDFRFLNNGVTITCESYSSPTENRKHFKVHYPGIVNGLQTVVALQTAHKELPEDERKDFEQNTSVLVRILTKNAVDDITDVVRATNNQNPMKPRNLVSNSSEQIGFSKLFAKQLGWFYEAKEGAWNAFEKDAKRWRPSLNKTVRDFKSKNKIRKIDNLELAQTWLSFFGCSSTAAEERQYLFEKRHYDLIFNRRVKKHGYHFDYSAKAAKSQENSDNYSPDVNLMLVSYLSFNFAKYIVPTPKENRKACFNRLGDDINKKLEIEDYKKLSTVELDGKMFEYDNEFALNSILRYMPFLFTDFVGFVLFESLGESIYSFSKNIIMSPSFSSLKDNLDYDSVKEKIKNENFENNDLLVILWLIFYDKIEDWVNTDWKQSYRGADRKQRFVLSKETRNKLYHDIISMDKFMKKKPLTKIWAIGVNEGQGLFEYIDKVIR